MKLFFSRRLTQTAACWSIQSYMYHKIRSLQPCQKVFGVKEKKPKDQANYFTSKWHKLGIEGNTNFMAIISLLNLNT